MYSKMTTKQSEKYFFHQLCQRKKKMALTLLWLLDYGWLSPSYHCFIFAFHWIISASLNVFSSQLEGKRQYHICPHLSFRRSY